MAKANYSFRLEDNIVALIDGEPGNTRTEKFEALVLKRIEEKQDLDRRIANAKNRLQALNKQIDQVQSISTYLGSIERSIKSAADYARQIDKIQEKGE